MAALTVGGAFLSAALQVLFDKLSSPLIRKLGSALNVEDNLRRLARTLSKIHSLVAHTEMLHVSDPVLAMWLRELKDVAYDTEDVIDDFAAEAQRRELERSSSSSSSGRLLYSPGPQSFRNEVARRIDEIQQRLTEIAEDRNYLRLPESISDDPPRLPGVAQWRQTSSLHTERYVCGREDDTETIIRMLLGGSGQPRTTTSPSTSASTTISNLLILPIVGMGGLGKTTLARLIYNDPRVQQHFQTKIWICVSNDFNVRRITQEILESASRGAPCDILNWNKLQTNLREKLSWERFLLVLDDVWNENQQAWERLCAPLSSARQGSALIVTTRSKRVADIVSTRTLTPFHLGALSEDSSWDLLQSCAFVDKNWDDHPKLVGIGRKIVKRLKGVPLAVKTIGGLLSLNLDESTWVWILESEIWKLPQYETDIMPALRLSYQHMPAHLKLCFAYCSLFPKGYEFKGSTLVQIWMAQGFIQPQENRRIEDIGVEYLDELSCRSFFQKVRSSYRMHDLMHDLAQSVSTGECLLIDSKASKNEIHHKVLHSSLFLEDSDMFEFKALYASKGLRTLLSLKAPPNLHRLPEEVFTNLKCIRVLDLSQSQIQELPRSIDNLKHLRYLDLSSTRIQKLPESMYKLFSLQTMKLLMCPLSELPKCMNRLIHLRHLEANADLVSKIDGIGKLTSLQKLEKFEILDAQGRKLDELKDMIQIRGQLHISKLENTTGGEEATEAELNNKQYLDGLELEWGAGPRDETIDGEVLEGLLPHPNLKALVIRGNGGDKFPSWLANQQLPNLENISLVKCKRWQRLPPLGELSFLKCLEIGALPGAQRLGHEFWGPQGFHSLQKLQLYEMVALEEFADWEEKNLFPSLRELSIKECPRLRELPTLPHTLALLSIKKVGLGALPRLWGCDGPSSSSSFSSLSSLQVSECPNLTSLQGGLLQHHLRALESLTISDCVGLVQLPVTGFRMLSSLMYLVIENCPLLTPFPEVGGLPTSLVSLKYSKFIEQSLSNHLHNLASLSSLSISGSINLLSLSGEVLSHLTELTILNVIACEELTALGTQALVSLTSLTVTNCPRLTSLTDGEGAGLQNLSRLRTVSIRDCATLGSLPADLRSLSALQKLHIENCPRVQSLPVNGLPASLQMLVIRRCPELGRRCQPGGADRSKIPYTTTVEIVVGAAP